MAAWFAPVLAASAWTGALHPRPLPLLVCAAVVAAVLAARRPVLLVLATALLASALSCSAWAGLAPTVDQGFEGAVTLVADPTDGLGGQVRADVRLPDGHRVEAVAEGGDGALLLERAAGERLVVRGTLGPPPDGASWLVPRHVRGRLQVEEVAGWQAGNPVTRAANGLRRTLAHGARSMGDDERALFAGLVLGDDRAQSPEDTDAFRAAGLGHLLAVSGQNVAFVLVVVQPIARRFGARGRLVAIVVALGFFACVTRFEPSVLRAVAMAGIAALASSSGRSLAGIQALGLSVAALVLVDPLLVHALGFRLSVAASGGILLLSPRLRDRLPGPRWLAEAAAVTIAAQVAVAPLLLPAFGGMPVAALPANVLAGPAAGPITAWGLTGGLLAGFVPGPVASLLHLPTRLLLWWIDAVAHAAVRASLGELGVVHVVALVVLVGAALLAVRRRPRRVGVGVRSSVALLVVLVLVQPAVALRGPHPSAVDLHGGAVLHRAHGGSVLVVDGRSQPAALLEALRRQGVTRLDLVVARTAGAGLVLDVLRQRYRGVQVAGPEGASDADLVVSEPTVLAVGAVALMVVPRGASLVEEGPPSGSDTGPVR